MRVSMHAHERIAQSGQQGTAPSAGARDERAEREGLIRLLRETPPEMIAAAGERDTVLAFRRAASLVPSYRALLAERGVRAEDVVDMDSFRRLVPLLDKHLTFGAHSIADLAVGGSLSEARSVLTSSGHSGVFSFGVNTRVNQETSAQSIDTGLQYLFGVDERRTLLINCLPMGVKVHTRATVIAETSVRDDMVYALIKKFGPEFDQIILVGEGSFIKKIVEDGEAQHGIDWPKVPVHIITGEEGIAENYRTYLAARLGIDDMAAPGSRLVGSSMGVAELDLNIFHETRETIEIRRRAHADPALRAALFGADARVCPMLFVYYPHRCTVETSATGELVVSMLSAHMHIPLLRYRAGDLGRVYGYREMVDALGARGIDAAPDLKLPFVAVAGRGKALEAVDGRLTPEEVKEALYHDHAVARAVTGNFRLTRTKSGRARIDVQLRKGVKRPKDGEARLADALARYAALAPERIVLRPYREFPVAVELDYERKFRYVG